MQLIRLKDVLQEMEKREAPFSITFVTYDKKKGTGGKIITIENAMQSGKAQADTSNAIKTGENPNIQAQANTSKAPNHYKNRTRNIRILQTNQIRKVHIRLITGFNGKKVIY